MLGTCICLAMPQRLAWGPLCLWKTSLAESDEEAGIIEISPALLTGPEEGKENRTPNTGHAVKGWQESALMSCCGAAA